MSIVASDLVLYCAANMPEDDTSLNGGAIDPLRRLFFSTGDISATDKVEAVSSAAGDTTQTCSVTGRKADGTQATDVIALNGTTAVIGSSTFERIEKVELSATCAGIITVRRQAAGATVTTIPIGERGAKRAFIAATADPSSGKNYYMKGFYKNTNGSLALLSAVVKQNADPTGLITHALEDATGDSHTTANRITAPSANVTAFDDTDKNVPGTNLSSAAAIGIWFKLALSAGNAAVKNTYTVELDGSTT